MKPIYIDLKYNSHEPLYTQLYDRLKGEIVSGGINPGERLPSLRALSNQTGVSITTCSRAYDQLLLEGYLESKPQSGYYVTDLDLGPANTFEGPGEISKARSSGRWPYAEGTMDTGGSFPAHSAAAVDRRVPEESGAEPTYLCDPACFDFARWKKCAAGVIMNKQEALLFPADPQGEYELRLEISKYLYDSRGVSAMPDQIVISAGVQQLTNHLARILSHMGIDFVNVEDPGYKPVQHIFRDRGFTINKVPVAADGIEIEKLPVNLETSVYVSPSNQFPTGSVMPAARRYSLIKWAEENGSVIIEDDYDSELRYFGDPVPALKSLDNTGCVVYLGSFSSTLFPAIRISYMVLPENLKKAFDESKSDYDQTCSKIEQLTLASFMEQGFYRSGIRKLRKLYSRKLQAVISAFRKYGKGIAEAEDTRSGISMRLRVTSEKTEEELVSEAEKLRLHMVPLPEKVKRRLLFYYDQIPEDMIDDKVREVCEIWNTPAAESDSVIRHHKVI